MGKIKNTLRQIFHKKKELPIDVIPNIDFKMNESELLKIPRYQNGEIDFLGQKLSFTDSASTRFIISEIFEKEIYKFYSDIETPYIVDCGANIGLGVIYFKRLFPKAEIVAFEPDENVFNALQKNMESYALGDVDLIQKALWNEKKKIKFHSEGADAGRVLNNEESGKTISVNAIRLESYLNKPVDFLKIDIEGAETTVLKDCREKLINVKKIFVEYHSFVNQKQELAELIDLLIEAGFRLNINTPGLVSKQPFVKINQYCGMDMQLNIYAFRV
ncbi:MAG: FkbM family methyltransferase [Bacteroidetes bacterium]|nr:FkbM family methyltransferase [Bacteroidota bacterium]